MEIPPTTQSSASVNRIRIGSALLEFGRVKMSESEFGRVKNAKSVLSEINDGTESSDETEAPGSGVEVLASRSRVRKAC